jgi:hypothetical protein
MLVDDSLRVDVITMELSQKRLGALAADTEIAMPLKVDTTEFSPQYIIHKPSLKPTILIARKDLLITQLCAPDNARLKAGEARSWSARRWGGLVSFCNVYSQQRG